MCCVVLCVYVVTFFSIPNVSISDLLYFQKPAHILLYAIKYLFIDLYAANVEWFSTPSLRSHSLTHSLNWMCTNVCVCGKVIVMEKKFKICNYEGRERGEGARDVENKIKYISKIATATTKTMTLIKNDSTHSHRHQINIRYSSFSHQI